MSGIMVRYMKRRCLLGGETGWLAVKNVYLLRRVKNIFELRLE